MTDDDDDFWTTYIATTPEEDADFAGCVKPGLGIGLGLALIALLMGVLLAAVGR